MVLPAANLTSAQDTDELLMNIVNNRNFCNNAVRSLGAQPVIELLTNALDHGRVESLVLARDIAVRRLQDVAGEYALLPRRVRLSQITERRYVGGGGEASIWLAKLEGEPVVSRECPHPEDGDWEGEDGRRILKVVRREVITLLQIQHPSIAEFLGTATDIQHPLALISPHYTHGHALRYIRKLDHSLRLTAVLRISIAVAAGLRYLHSQKPPIFHGDLHGQNIVINDEGKALLIDFGIARIKHEVTRTKTGIATGGRYRYMAPELYSAILNDQDFRTSSASDSYSFGMTILEMLTLQPPFPQYSTAEAAAQQALRGIRPPRPASMEDVIPKVHNGLWDLLDALWKHNPDSRPKIDATHNLLEILSSLLPTTPRGEGSRESQLADALNTLRDMEDWVILDDAEWRERPIVN